MSGDFNQPGQEYKYYRVNPLRIDYGMLPEVPYKLFSTIYMAIRKRWNSVGGEEQKYFMAINGCLSRLMSFFLQVSRVARHAEEIHHIVIPEDIEHLAHSRKTINNRLTLLVTSDNGQVMAISAQEACIDFDMLLLHSESTLDQLTYCIPSETNSQYKRNYENIESVLKSVTANSFLLPAKLSLNVVKEAAPYLKDLLHYDSKGEALSKEKQLSHLHLVQPSSDYENTSQLFVIHQLENQKILRFDCTLRGHSILKSTQELSMIIPYVVLNTLSFFLFEKHTVLPRVSFEPLWENPTIAYDEFLDETNSGPRFTVFQDNPGGFHLRTRHLSETVLTHAEKEIDEAFATETQHGQGTTELVKGIVDTKGNDNLQSNEVKGDLFEEIMNSLLTRVHQGSMIERNKILKDKGEQYEYDFIIHNPGPREIIIIEVKGYKKEKRINLGDRNTKETVQWFFRRTFPFAKRIYSHFEDYAIKACYITSSKFTNEAIEFLEKQNDSRLRSANLEVFYDGDRLRKLLKENYMNDSIKKLERHFSK